MAAMAEGGAAQDEVADQNLGNENSKETNQDQ